MHYNTMRVVLLIIHYNKIINNVLILMLYPLYEVIISLSCSDNSYTVF